MLLQLTSYNSLCKRSYWSRTVVDWYRKGKRPACGSSAPSSSPCWLKMDVVTSAIETNAQEKSVSQWEFSCDLEVDYKSEENAFIIYSALAVDKELQPDKVRRLMSVSNGILSVRFEAIEARFLRASYSAFVDVLTLATKTIEQFGKNMEL